MDTKYNAMCPGSVEAYLEEVHDSTCDIKPDMEVGKKFVSKYFNRNLNLYLWYSQCNRICLHISTCNYAFCVGAWYIYIKNSDNCWRVGEEGILIHCI